MSQTLQHLHMSASSFGRPRSIPRLQLRELWRVPLRLLRTVLVMAWAAVFLIAELVMAPIGVVVGFVVGLIGAALPVVFASVMLGLVAQWLHMMS